MNGVNQFVERGLNVHFTDDWQVVKLDEHRYYKTLSGRGFKGVDFLAFHKQEGLYLIELKNYSDTNSDIPENLIDVMVEKQEDTLLLLTIINKYYCRQWSYRLIHFLGWRKLYKVEWLLWTDMYAAIESGRYTFLGVVDW